ncbi:MAG: hypothetical protein KatS3mg114_0359 [Planctomycetaceae bacterium]|nr:MAG: hypothetical protein KatS3mg114_0359 [Planctomycetaceae bacterium]
MSYDFPSQTDQTDHTSPALLPTQHATLWLCLLGSMGLAIAAWQPFSVLAKDACFLPEVSQKDSSCTTEAPRSPSGHGTSSQTEQPAKERPHLAPSVPEAEPVIAGLTLSGWQQQLNLLHPEIPRCRAVGRTLADLGS